MISHAFSLFYRTILRSKFQLAIIISGLAVAIAVSLLILMYVKGETGYDRHHADWEKIYRVNTTLTLEGKEDRTAKAGLNTGEVLMEFFDEVETHTQVLNIGKQTIEIDDDLYSSETAIYADSNFFTFFSYSFIAGDANSSMTRPNTAVLSENVATTFFGSAARALGSSMKVNNSVFEVTGVYASPAPPTHIPHDMFLSLATLKGDFLNQRSREFMWLTTYNYIKLKQADDIVSVNERLTAFHEKYLVPYLENYEINGTMEIALQNIADIHLDPTLRFDFPGATDPMYIRLFIAIAILTLLIAIVNYINLTTAWVAKRFKEIGIKKSLGASRFSLIVQFILESMLTIGCSYLIALVLFALSLPALNELTGKPFSADQFFNVNTLIYSLIFIGAFGLLAGIYPAVILSAYKPVEALKSTGRTASRGITQRFFNPRVLRRMLVVAQFSISAFLIVATLVVYQQFGYFRDQNPGFDKDQVMVIDIPNDTAVANKLDVIRASLMQIPAVESVSATSSIPGGSHGALTMNVSQTGGTEVKVINIFIADDQFLKTLDLTLTQGRFFSREFSTDPQQAFIINEAAAHFLGWDEPIGKRIQSPLGQEGEVVGVVKDFHYKSLHSTIEPLIIMNTINTQGYLLVNLSTQNLTQTVESVGDAWSSFDADHPYEYFFLDEKFQEQYVREERLMKIFIYFSGVAIFISCLGLVGLAVFTHESKVREIGVRKTFGASDSHIFGLLSRDFLILIIVANLIAWPVSWYLVNEWLNQFAYKTAVGAFPFITGLIACVGMAFLTMSWFVYRAARQDVVVALKHE